MKKKLYYALVLICPFLVTTIYAIIHDQIAYTFSNEFFTKYQFYQFGLSNNSYEWIPENPRIQVLKASFIGSWWIGLIFSIVYTNLISFRRYRFDNKQHLKIIFKTITIHFFIVVITSLIGYFYGLKIAKNNIQSLLNENPQLKYVQNIPRFFAVYYMDIFSYIGGGLGLIISLTVKKLYLNKNLQLVYRDIKSNLSNQE